MLTKFNELASDAQVAFLLAPSDKIVNIISASTGYEKAVEALKECWNWVETKNVSGDKLYEFLDTIDETGLFVLMQLEEDERKLMVWNCVVTAISFTTWKAYKFNGEKYLPAPIEEVDEDLIEYFIDNFNAINAKNKDTLDKLLEYLLANHPKNSQESIDKEKVLSIIK
ncbi:Imm6 family immunity protein [Laceyella putida]|uniref:Imm6 family immunity protein n=1 Tax=Laceyella putida TaxID=110101 RepID=A0ABW2RHX9_9BACL